MIDLSRKYQKIFKNDKKYARLKDLFDNFDCYKQIREGKKEGRLHRGV